MQVAERWNCARVQTTANLQCPEITITGNGRKMYFGIRLIFASTLLNPSPSPCACSPP